MPRNAEFAKLQAANREGGYSLPKSEMMQGVGSDDAAAQVRATASRCVQLMACVFPGEEDAVSVDLDAAIENDVLKASIQFGKIVMLLGAQQSEAIRREWSTYPALSKVLTRLHRVTAVSEEMQPWLNASQPQQLLREITDADHSTPGKYAFHYDGLSMNDRRLRRELVERYASRADVMLGARCCFTLGTENVTRLGDAAGRTLLTLRAPYPNAGVAMDVRVRGFNPDGVTRLLHAGGQNMPTRFQMVFDWAVFNPCIWNSEMAAMQLEELGTAADFDPKDPATVELIEELLKVVIE